VPCSHRCPPSVTHLPPGSRSLAGGTTVRVVETPELSRSRLDSNEVKQPVTMLNDRVLVHVPDSEGERRSRAGILIPATAAVARRLSWAEVAAVGPNVRSIRPGDRVLFNPEECFEVEVKGEDFLILRERDIPAVASERLEDGTGLYL
jgi:chaperonin GroES